MQKTVCQMTSMSKVNTADAFRTDCIHTTRMHMLHTLLTMEKSSNAADILVSKNIALAVDQ